jgi:hypothetical protein
MIANFKFDGSTRMTIGERTIGGQPTVFVTIRGGQKKYREVQRFDTRRDAEHTFWDLTTVASYSDKIPF